jgi:ankyrin repeat protein
MTIAHPFLAPTLISILALTAVSACNPSGSAQKQGAELLEIAEQGDLSALNALLKPATKVDVRDSCDWTPLMKAALYGHIEVVERLLDAGATIDAQDNGGYTAMMLAASNNHAQIVDLLLSRGAMVDHQEQTHGWTALSWAGGKGHTETVEILLRHGADHTLEDFAGHTAKDRARESGQQAVIERLAARSR